MGYGNVHSHTRCECMRTKTEEIARNAGWLDSKLTNRTTIAWLAVNGRTICELRLVDARALVTQNNEQCMETNKRINDDTISERRYATVGWIRSI